MGNVTDTHVAWFAEDDIPDICSPISTGELVYILTTDGFVTCYQVKDGKKLWDHEIEKSHFNASPSLVGDKLYLLTLKGVMRIVQTGGEYKEIGTCDLGEKCYASPAFVDGRIYIRGAKNLYCIGKKN
jgi:outer membrane protein assembly factor BamB